MAAKSFDEPLEPEMTLEELLEKVGLQDKFQLFQDEQIDMESLVTLNLKQAILC